MLTNDTVSLTIMTLCHYYCLWHKYIYYVANGNTAKVRLGLIRKEVKKCQRKLL